MHIGSQSTVALMSLMQLWLRSTIIMIVVPTAANSSFPTSALVGKVGWRLLSCVTETFAWLTNMEVCVTEMPFQPNDTE